VVLIALQYIVYTILTIRSTSSLDILILDNSLSFSLLSTFFLLISSLAALMAYKLNIKYTVWSITDLQKNHYISIIG